MALPDLPPYIARWDTGLEPELLQAIGTLAVVSAKAEETLHKIYWKYTGLDERSGPIVTDNLNPKRLEEDIKKLVGLDASKANVLADLKILFTEFEILNTKRNHCIHWIWEISEPLGDEKRSVVVVTRNEPEPPNPLRQIKVKRPAYRQSGILSQEFRTEDVEEMCREFSWLHTRLKSHSVTEDELRQKRREIETSAAAKAAPGASYSDLFWPAPWLDKPLPPDLMPSNRPETQK